MAQPPQRHFGEQLQQKQLNGDGRIEDAFAPAVSQLAAKLQDPLFGKKLIKVLLDMTHRAGESRHPWPPVEWRFEATPF